MRAAIVERCVGGAELEWPRNSVVVVGVERRGQEVADQHQHQQPAREPPCAARATDAAAMNSERAFGERHGRLRMCDGIRAIKGASISYDGETDFEGNVSEHFYAPLIRTLSNLTELTNTRMSGPR